MAVDMQSIKLLGALMQVTLLECKYVGGTCSTLNHILESIDQQTYLTCIKMITHKKDLLSRL